MPSDTPGLIEFEPFFAVDWRAQSTALGFDPDNPTDADLVMLSERDNPYTDAELNFPVGLDRAAHVGCYRLLSAEGIERIELTALRGTARFALSEAAPVQVLERTYFGYALATAVNGGFVMWTPSCVTTSRVASASFSLERNSGPVFLHYRDGERHAEAAMPRRWFTAILRAYGFSVAGRRYAFIEWPADADGAVEAMCEYNYSIYAVEATLRLVAHNNYGCDL
ncbi:MAG: hypothetical protein M0D54_20020 [Hyphomonadaceae bacterium JAD_PAG50586_4]|nr:MAG: hypothetical protein M0D54_20020 [Hyphomonadaceae bacterium JAD_PAG50586_4]